MTQRIQYYYRGSLKSCNYSCSYCPFSKHRMTQREMEEDEKNLSRFTDMLLQRMDRAVLREEYAAVLVVPYGEALLHPWYWKELARLSRHPGIEAVGAQSNFSFVPERMLAVFLDNGGVLPKLRLWGTFHPQMVSVDGFVGRCEQLKAQGVAFCAGAVGVPAHLEKIRLLRERLPEDVYLWVNRMDGMGRAYTERERKAFLEIDEYFHLELLHHRANAGTCVRSVFVEAGKGMRRCNISRRMAVDFASFVQEDAGCREGETGCGRKECSCFLAYCNHHMPDLLFFEPYPAFRLPWYPKAAFFDVDGTLVTEGGKIQPEIARRLKALARHSRIYLVTSLPPADARRRTAAVWEDLSGGAFAGGAVIRLRSTEGEGWQETAVPLDMGELAGVCSSMKEAGCHISMYRKGDSTYKITVRPKRWTEEREWHLQWEFPESCQVLWEGRHLQITGKGTGKLNAVKSICAQMGYGRGEVFVAGDSEADMPMLEYYPHSMKL